jgi:hypothetical protein
MERVASGVPDALTSVFGGSAHVIRAYFPLVDAFEVSFSHVRARAIVDDCASVESDNAVCVFHRHVDEVEVDDGEEAFLA